MPFLGNGGKIGTAGGQIDPTFADKGTGNPYEDPRYSRQDDWWTGMGPEHSYGFRGDSDRRVEWTPAVSQEAKTAWMQQQQAWQAQQQQAVAEINAQAAQAAQLQARQREQQRVAAWDAWAAEQKRIQQQNMGVQTPVQQPAPVMAQATNNPVGPDPYGQAYGSPEYYAKMKQAAVKW